MNISGQTSIVLVVPGRENRTTRVASRFFNAALKAPAMMVLDAETSHPIVLSKNLSWADCGAAIRNGKKVAAKVEVPPAAKVRKPRAKKNETEETVV